MLRAIPYLLVIDLRLFDGAAAPAAEGSSAPAAEAPASAVVYGKQPEQTAAPTASPKTETPKAEPPVDKDKAFRELIQGEYKDQYTKESQRLINRRFKETEDLRAAKEAAQPVLGLLFQRYGITDGNMQTLQRAVENDTAMWQEAADQAGMTVTQYQAMKRLEAQNAQLQAAQRQSQSQYMAQIQYRAWQSEAEAMKEKYPEFSLEAMEGNDLFYLLLRNKYPMEEAYRAASVGELEKRAAENAQKAVTENIKARGNRPAEAGASTAPAFTVKDDVNKLTDQDVKDILKRIGNRERVTFG